MAQGELQKKSPHFQDYFESLPFELRSIRLYMQFFLQQQLSLPTCRLNPKNVEKPIGRPSSPDNEIHRAQNNGMSLMRQYGTPTFLSK
jgi:hypothetical protein